LLIAFLKLLLYNVIIGKKNHKEDGADRIIRADAAQDLTRLQEENK